MESIFKIPKINKDPDIDFSKNERNLSELEKLVTYETRITMAKDKILNELNIFLVAKRKNNDKLLNLNKGDDYIISEEQLEIKNLKESINSILELHKDEMTKKDEMIYIKIDCK
jgi:hypothetical protein